MGLEWRKIGDDWLLVSKSLSLILSFDSQEWVKRADIEGDFEADDRGDELLMLAEGSLYPYGYEPIYRDVKTQLLVMKRNRSLTPEQEARARTVAVNDEGRKIQKEHIEIMEKRLVEMKAIRSEGDYSCESC